MEQKQNKSTKSETKAQTEKIKHKANKTKGTTRKENKHKWTKL